MALAFPLALNQFWDLLPVERATFDLPETMEISRTRSGEVLMAEKAARLWTGEIGLGLMSRSEVALVRPLINLLRSSAGSFLVASKEAMLPQRDPTGALLGAAAANVKLASVTAREITLGGLPVGYTLSRDDLIAWTYGTNPVRYAVHQVVSHTVSAGSNGITGLIEVVPPVRAGTAVDTPAFLQKPACKAIILPDNFQAGTTRRGGWVEGMSFRWQQTFR